MVILSTNTRIESWPFEMSKSMTKSQESPFQGDVGTEERSQLFIVNSEGGVELELANTESKRDLVNNSRILVTLRCPTWEAP